MSSRASYDIMIKQSEKLSQELRKFAEDIRQFESGFKACVKKLEEDNMSKEMLEHLQTKQLEEITKQLRGIEKFISNETLQYSNRVTKQLTSLQRKALGRR